MSDPQRVDYTPVSDRTRRLWPTAEIGGYFHWSPLDNFQWAEGTSSGFGLVHVDIPSGRRTRKTRPGINRSSRATAGL